MNWNRWLLVTFIMAGMMSAAFGVIIGRTLFKPHISSNPLLLSGLRPPAQQLDSALGLLLSKKPAELEQTDIETLYLSSFAGLPGTKDVDLDRARAHFADLAKMIQAQTGQAFEYQHRLSQQFKDSPGFKALVLMQVLKIYEQQAVKDENHSLPENLFLRNEAEPIPKTHFAGPLEATLAGQQYEPSMPEDLIPDVSRAMDTLNNPILILVVGRLLGYPLYLVKAPDHLFVRWQSDDGKTVFDIDDAGLSGSIIDDPIRLDSDYEHPPENEMKEGGYFQSLSHAGLMALFLQRRGHVMRQQHRGVDAELAYAAAHRFAPDVPLYTENMIELVGEEMRIRDMKWKDLAERNGYYLNLNPPKPDKSIIP